MKKWGGLVDTGRMDIPALATGLSEARLKSDVGYAVARKALNAAEQQGAAMVALIEKAGQVGKGDALAARATGKGGQIDVYG